MGDAGSVQSLLQRIGQELPENPLGGIAPLGERIRNLEESKKREMNKRKGSVNNV